MSDTPIPTPADIAPPAQVDPPEPKVEEIDWKAKARDWEKRAKENKSAADELAEIREANKTAEQKAAERTATAEKRAAEAEAKVARRDIAIELKLSKEDAALLDDLTDEDAMRRLAGRLAGAGSDKRKTHVVSGEGKTPPTGTGDADRRTFVRQLSGRE